MSWVLCGFVWSLVCLGFLGVWVYWVSRVVCVCVWFRVFVFVCAFLCFLGSLCVLGFLLCGCLEFIGWCVCLVHCVCVCGCVLCASDVSWSSGFPGLSVCVCVRVFVCGLGFCDCGVCVCVDVGLPFRAANPGQTAHHE